MTEMGMFWRKDMVVCDEMDHCNKDLIYCCISQYVPPLHTFRSIASHNAYIINTKKFEIFTRLCNMKINAHIIPSLSV